MTDAAPTYTLTLERTLAAPPERVFRAWTDPAELTQRSIRRDRDDFEGDIVLEQGALAVAGVEVKAAATVKESDLRGLRKLRAAAGKRFVAGVVLYDGTAGIAVGDGLFAVPVRKLWETA